MLSTNISIAEKLRSQPKVLVIKMGQEDHDRGAKVIATAFDELGIGVSVDLLLVIPADATDQTFREISISSASPVILQETKRSP